MLLLDRSITYPISLMKSPKGGKAGRGAEKARVPGKVIASTYAVKRKIKGLGKGAGV